MYPNLKLEAVVSLLCLLGIRKKGIKFLFVCDLILSVVQLREMCFINEFVIAASESVEL